MKTVLDYLRNSYESYPDNIACADENEEITYRTLWENSDKICAWINDNENRIISPVVIVGIKSIRILETIWGIIKCGACYTVIDPILPKERIHGMLSTLSPQIVITDSKYRKKIDGNWKVLELDVFFQCKDLKYKTSERCKTVSDTEPLYIMFTSGSTGIPKGVVVNHRSVIDFIDEFTKTFGIRQGDVVGNQAPWDFDVSIKDIFSSAKAGARLQIIPRKLFSFPDQLVDYLAHKHVTTLIWSVSALRIVSSSGELERGKLRDINKIIFSGEVMPPKHYNTWRKHFPTALFANVYGPTEITCNCTYYIQNGLIGDNDIIPIGRAFENEKVFLLNENDTLVAEDEPSVVGEICVSGTAVAMGYYANEEASKKVFVQNPLNSKYREIIYRTGDMAFYSDDGQLIYNGRKDNQIKHNGHRIELEEIEKAIGNLSCVGAACCCYIDESIVAFVEGKAEKREITKALRKILPDYMIPEHVYILEKMPINLHGKIDRIELRKRGLMNETC